MSRHLPNTPDELPTIDQFAVRHQAASELQRARELAHDAAALVDRVGSEEAHRATLAVLTAIDRAVDELGTEAD